MAIDNPVLTSLFEAQQENITKYSDLKTRLEAAEGDLEKALEVWMNTSEDETAKALRNARDEATRRLRVLAEANVQTEELSDEVKEKMRTELNSLKDTLRSGSRLILKAAETFGSEDLVKEAADQLKAVGDPTVGTRVSSSDSKAGSGLPRVSVKVKIYQASKPEEVHSFENLGSAATFMGYDAGDFQKEFAKAAGVDHEDIKTVKDPQKWTMTRPNSDVQWTIETAPKETKPRGRAAVSTTATLSTNPKDPAELPPAVAS